MLSFANKRKSLTSFQIIILGFAGVILAGAFLLMLPISTKDRIATPFLEALFTSTSAVCVTGLVVQDTATYWSAFGQGIILILIQIGGLGVIKAEVFMAEHPEHAAFTVVVEPVGEGDAANNMLTDVDSGADLYVFAQDQLARLAASGALVEVEVSQAERIRREHDPAAVEAASLGGVLYALPVTADNGYFLYYDKSVVSDPTRLETILEDCRRAGKRFYMEINNGWYQPAFFFGAGAVLRYDTDAEGRMIGMDCTYASSAGLRALRAMIDLAAHPAFVNGSSASNATNMGALVSGVWDQATVQSLLGENYAAAVLPTVDGWQLGGFSGCKLLGVKPQTDARKLAACDALAAWLTSGEVQLARYREPAIQWGPSHTLAQAETSDNLALSALRQQADHATVQGQYPNEYWNLASALGDDILARRYVGATDEELMQVLVSFQTTAGSYVDAP